MKKLTKLLVSIVVALYGFPLSAYAHFTTDMGDFYGGILHPLTDSRTILPILAFAIWTSQQTVKNAGRMMLLFIGVIPAGAFIGFSDTGLTPGPAFWLSTLAVISFLTIRAYRPALPFALVLTFLLSVYTGYANVFEVKARVGQSMLYILGLCLGAGLLVLYIAGFILSRKAEWKNTATRVSSGVIFATGVLFFLLEFPF